MDDNTGNLIFLNNSSKCASPLFSNDDAHYNALCTELTRSRTLNDFTQRIDSIVKGLGFTHFMFMRLERTWATGSQSGLLSSMPEELTRIYHEERMHENDLIIPYGKTNSQPIFSSQVYGYIEDAPFEIELTRKNRALVQLYKRFSFFDHYVIPLPALNANGNVQLVLTNVDAEKQAFQSKVTPLMPTCRSLCKAIDTVSTNKFRSAFIDKKDNPLNITRKPLHILHRLSNTDITITELAKEMCISPITAHQHIAAARKALGVKTNIGAITKAIKAGLITLG